MDRALHHRAQLDARRTTGWRTYRVWAVRATPRTPDWHRGVCRHGRVGTNRVARAAHLDTDDRLDRRLLPHAGARRCDAPRRQALRLGRHRAGGVDLDRDASPRGHARVDAGLPVHVTIHASEITDARVPRHATP